jgi:hypothetical protein
MLDNATNSRVPDEGCEKKTRTIAMSDLREDPPEGGAVPQIHEESFFT